MLPQVIADVSPTTVSYTASQFVSGFTGPLNTTKDAQRVYFRGQLTLWSGYISGTEAKWTMTSEYGDYDGGVQVAVDGGAFINAPRSGQVYTLFTGVPHAAHFVEIRIAQGLGDVAYMASSGNVLTVTGQPPALLTFTNKIQVGADSALGLYSGSMMANSVGFTPPLEAVKGNQYGSNIGSVKIKGAFNKLVVTLNGDRKIAVSKNGAAPTFYTATGETDHPSRAMVIPLDGSLSTYNVWDDGNYYNTGGVFAVATDSAFLDIGTRRRLDQYGDSVTFGSGPGATSVDTETMRVAAAMGFVGSTNGISGQTITGGKAMLDLVLAGRNVGINDVAILALGGNSAADGIDTTEQNDYNIMIDKLLTKGYGKVFCRGILPLANEGANALIITANNVLKGLVQARNDPRVVWVETSTWTGYEALDGVHPTAAGYVTIGNYALPAYQSLLA
jgi:lysophospholipase L1-like esterase